MYVSGKYKRMFDNYWSPMDCEVDGDIIKWKTDEYLDSNPVIKYEIEYHAEATNEK